MAFLRTDQGGLRLLACTLLAGISPALLGQGGTGWMLNGPDTLGLEITATVEWDALTRDAVQTLTFTFEGDVSGFDADDVILDGAAKGAFSAQGGPVYTLEITGEGGTINVHVPTGAAQGIDGRSVSNAASYTYFYQDTITFSIPSRRKGGDPVLFVSERGRTGSYRMGSIATERSRGLNEDQIPVTITNDYYMLRTEITQAQWEVVMGPTWPGEPPSATYGVSPDRPAYNVSWNDAVEYARVFEETSGWTGIISYRLPTEAEWESATRAGTTTRYYFGDGLGPDDECSDENSRSIMWICAYNGAPGTPTYGVKGVQRRPQNQLNLFDLHGNVAELCSDYYSAQHLWPEQFNPQGPITGTQRVVRGGHWESFASEARSASRAAVDPNARDPRVGFRLAGDAFIPLTISTASGIEGPNGQDGSISHAASETITFTFKRPVSGFDAGDITVTGATMGSLTMVSPTVYTLPITATAGLVSVTVPRKAAKHATPLAAGLAAWDYTGGAVLQYYYRPRLTVTLPGGVPLNLVEIPAGSFFMGSSPTEGSDRGADEEYHFVTLTEDFYIGETEITQEQWSALQPFPEPQTYPGPSIPVHGVSWNDVQSWLTALNAHVGESGAFGLPTEAQWEYACRGGSQKRFHFGDAFGRDVLCSTESSRASQMWYCGNNSPEGPKPVGQFAANAFGLFDMHGNVYEFCSDWYGAYPAGASTDPAGPASGPGRVYRGGSAFTSASFNRAACRFLETPEARGQRNGFRLVAVRRAVPLTITGGGVTNGGTSSAAEETLTFTFGRNVTGFDAGDVVLTGASKETFTAVSGSVYTLSIRAGAPGPIAAVVPSGAAANQTIPGSESLGANFSYTYSTSRTILLPGAVPIIFERIPAGTFSMGSPSTEASRGFDENAFPSTITNDFYMCRYEVTQGQWLALMTTWPGAAFNQVPTAGNGLGDNHPAYRLSWDDAQAYVAALNAHIVDSAQGPFVVRLPSEAEWEYACRAGTTTRFNFGDALGADDFCSTTPERLAALWYCGNTTSSRPVGQFPANRFGLFDMHGNVSEWVQDSIGNYPTTPQIDWSGPAPLPGDNKVVRGGGQSQLRFTRSAARAFSSPGAASRFVGQGFRLAGQD